jgi:3-oxoacyl-[acyl-carrier protein] reductase
MQIRFDGKTVVVSGAGHGFGRCIAETFAGLGARVYGCDLSAAELAETAKAGVSTEVLDLTDRAAAAAWIVEIEQTTGGAVDVLVNNSGGVAGQEMRPIDEVLDADWDRIFAVNIGAAYALSRAAAAGMKRAGTGRIVNISSGAGLAASLTGIQAYCSAKHAVVGFTRQLAHELGPFGITVNSVARGFVRSNPRIRRTVGRVRGGRATSAGRADRDEAPGHRPGYRQFSRVLCLRPGWFCQRSGVGGRRRKITRRLRCSVALRSP